MSSRAYFPDLCYAALVVLFVLRRVLGVICLATGLFALVTPFTPGSWLALIGLELLGLSFLIPRPVRAYIQKWKDAVRLRASTWWTARRENWKA